MASMVVCVWVYPIGGYHLLVGACGRWSLFDIREVDLAELEAEIERLRSRL